MKQNFQKNNKKIAQNKQFFSDFCSFLQSVEEDAPLPNETKYVYFIVDFSNKDVAVSYSANEQNLKIFDYGTYCPVSAQYVFSDVLNKLAKQIFDKKTSSKNDALILLKSASKVAKQKCKFLKNSSIFVGERFQQTREPCA